mmetsp:Transcript_10686/g.9403  ORF Transcript_10686/g.9403 Transcript_10686/m.9403 type:complete len:149 (+) Transcript_10686:488-934(+)
MLPENEVNQEMYFKKKSGKITSIISSIFLNSDSLGIPIQSMMTRNIRHFENISYLKFQNQKLNNQENNGKELMLDQEYEKYDKMSKEVQLILNQASKYKRVNNSILAFGFSERTNEIFSKVDNDKEELENDEEFDLLKWFFGSKALSF